MAESTRRVPCATRAQHPAPEIIGAMEAAVGCPELPAPAPGALDVLRAMPQVDAASAQPRLWHRASLSGSAGHVARCNLGVRREASAACGILSAAASPVTVGSRSLAFCSRPARKISTGGAYVVVCGALQYFQAFCRLRGLLAPGKVPRMCEVPLTAQTGE